ncbi:MAG: DUF1003 domain-containing protein [Gammaproteobacteria bacterium]|nr:DUF1003 domain-containing protein [Gammaproteobacteria bacterium]
MATEHNPTAAEQSATHKASQHIQENVEAISALYEKAEKETPPDQRSIELLVAALGRPRFLYLYVVVAAAWVGANLLARQMGAEPVDPSPFFWLQGCVASSSLLMTIVILIAQIRQSRLAERRAHLDLQVNLMAEAKIAKVIALLEELRVDSPAIKNRYDAVAEAMKQPADPQLVVQALEENVNLKP